MNRYRNCTDRASRCWKSSSPCTWGRSRRLASAELQGNSGSAGHRQTFESNSRGKVLLSYITMRKKKSKKHPREMTDEEALRHLFHPKIVRAVKKHLGRNSKKASTSEKG